MPTLIDLLAVGHSHVAGEYITTIVADIDNTGLHETMVFSVNNSDNYGISPSVRAAVVDWINSGKPVAPYAPPTLVEIRAAMRTLSRRQLLLALFSIGVTEAQVDTALLHDAEGMIEWKNASTFHRTHPLIDGMSFMFGLPPAQVDALWLWALEL